MPKRKTDDGMDDEVMVKINKPGKRKSISAKEEDVLQKVSPMKVETVSSEFVETCSSFLKSKKKKKRQKKTDDANEDCKDSKLDSPKKRRKKTDDTNEDCKDSKLDSPKKRRKKTDDANEDCKDSKLDSPEVKSVSQRKKSKSKGFVLFVGQIPHHVTQKDIERHFADIGGVKDVRLLIYPDSGRSRGCAYVEFDDQQHRTAAFKLNESMLGGGKIRVEFPYQGGKKYQKKGKQKGKNKSGNKKL